MGGALARGWMALRDVSSLEILEPVDLPGDLHVPHIRRAADISPDPDMVVLAVKPQVMADVCVSVKPYIPADVPVLSIAAGVRISVLQSFLHPGQPVIRAMPNTPAAIGKGISVATASPGVSATQKDAAHSLLSAGGAVEWVTDETLLDAVTALSGSGPAYVFYLIESMAQAGVKAGLDTALANRLARQTVVGAAAQADAESGVDAATLRQNVTSPGGTTEAALYVLMDGRWRDILNDAVQKAAARSRELSS